MLHAPALSDTSAEKQEDVDDILLVMNREDRNACCIIYRSQECSTTGTVRRRNLIL